MICTSVLSHGKQVGLDSEKIGKRIAYGGNCISKIRMLKINLRKNKWLNSKR